MFGMSVAAPAQEVSTLRMSRMAILERLIVFARAALGGLLRHGDFSAWSRIMGWMRLAITLQSRIRHGAFEEPRKPRAPRPERLIEYENLLGDLFSDLGLDLDEFDDEGAPGGKPGTVKSYLELPFGQVVSLICQGIGMTPDWDAWASEPWAQEEIATQPAGSPYVGYATKPPKTALPAPPPQRWPPSAPPALGLAAPPGLPAPPPSRQARRAEARRALTSSA